MKAVIGKTKKAQLKSGNPFPRNEGYYKWDEYLNCDNIWMGYFTSNFKNVRLGASIGDGKYIDAIIKCLIDFSQPLQDGYENNDITIDKIGLEARDGDYAITFTFKNGEKTSFDMLPMGLRRIFSIVFDIANRSYILNENINPEGVVFIDEVDLHLHPSLLKERDDAGAAVFDAATGQQVRKFKTRYVHMTMFSPDGKQVAVSDGRNTVYIYDFASGKLCTTIEEANYDIYCMSYSPDGKYFMTTSLDSTAKVWNAQTGELRRVFRGHGNHMECASFSPDGKNLLTCGGDGNVLVWNYKEKELKKPYDNLVYGLTNASFTPDGKRMALYSYVDHTLQEYDVQTCKPLRTIIPDIGMVASAYSPDGKYIATFPDLFMNDNNSGDSIVRIWDVNGKLIFSLEGHSSYVTSARFSSDSRFVATSSDDRTARIWKCSDGKLAMTLKGHEDCVTSVSYSPDGQRVVTASDDGTARIWDARTGRQLKVLIGHTGMLSSAVYSPNGKYIATGSMDNNVIVWDAESGEKIKTLKGPKLYILTVAFSPDSRYVIATSTLEHEIKVFDVESGEQVISLRCLAPANAVFTPDGKRIMAFSLYPFFAGECFAGAIKTWRFYQPQEIIDYFRKVIGDYQFTPYEELKYYLK